LRGGLGGEPRRALRARSLGPSRLGAAGGLQRGPLREARGALGGRSRRGGRAPARRCCVEHPDHVPHRPAPRRPRHAAGRVPARDRELLGSRGGGARARAADEDVPRGGRRRCGRGRAVKVVTAFPRPVRRIEHCWIPLPDGCRLAARLWLPEDADTSPVPAIVEYIPDRKRDFPRARDEPMHHYFAGPGYADDAHYMRGCLLNENLTWGSVLLASSALPPDPALVGERWRALWLARLDHAVLFPEVWLRHQRRDAYWRHTELERITCAVYAVGGWADAYTNAIPRLLAGLTAPRKGLIGPWAHVYPHTGGPGAAT